MTFLRWVDAWWMQPLNAQPLALFRVLTGVFALVYIIWQWQYLTSAASFDASQYEPVGIATLLDQPLASWAALSLLWMSIVLGVAYTLGWRFSLTGPLFAILLLWVMTYRNSWGQIYHTENLLVLHVLVLGFTRSADTLSLDGRREARAPEAGLEYGWPLRLCALITVLSYFLAGWAKLNISGMAWITDDVLRNHIAYDIIRYELMGNYEAPFGRWMLRQEWIFTPLAVATLAIELGAPLALLRRRVAAVWSIAIWFFHLGVLASMLIIFTYPLAGLAFLPLFAWDGEPVVAMVRRALPPLRSRLHSHTTVHSP